MAPPGTLARPSRLAFALLLGIGAARSTLAAQRSVDEFILVNAAPGVPLRMPVAANTGLDARAH